MNILKQLEGIVGKQAPAASNIPYWLKTSLPNVNMALSGEPDKAVPGGRIITIAGPESSGKTALATELMADCQRQGGFSSMQDSEHSFHFGHAAALGLNCGEDAENWFYNKPNTGEEAFSGNQQIMKAIRAIQLSIVLPNDTKKDPRASIKAIFEAMKKNSVNDMPPVAVLFDSIASMIPEAQDIEYSKQNMKTKNMEHAMMNSIEFKRLARDADNLGVTAIMLNQIRKNPGVMFGDSDIEPGGNAPKFYASIMCRIRRVSKWHETYDEYKTPIIGDVVEIYTRKNKVHVPFKKTKYVFRTVGDVGLDVIGTMMLLGKEAGVLGPVTGQKVEFDGKKNWTMKTLDDACRKNDQLKQALIDHVMKETNPVEEGQAVDDDVKGNAFAA